MLPALVQSMAMSYLDEAREHVLTAFEIDGVEDALSALQAAFWSPVDTYSEVLDLVAEVGVALGERGHVPEAEFCARLHESASRLSGNGPVGAEPFLVTCLQVAGWGKPSPTRLVRAYLERCEIRSAVASALLEVLSERRREHLESLRRDEARRDRVDSVKRFAGKAALAVGTFGVSLAFDDLY